MVFPKQGTGESHGEDGAKALPQLQFRSLVLQELLSPPGSCKKNPKKTHEMGMKKMLHV